MSRQRTRTNPNIVIAIGSRRRPKVEAVKTAMEKLRRVAPFSPAEIAYISRDVSSDIANTPMSQEEMMQGAYNRAHHVQAQLAAEGIEPAYAFGLEGGLFRIAASQQKAAWYLQSWVYVTDGIQGYFGSSPAVQIPHHVVAELAGENVELADIMDRLGDAASGRDKGGAFALLTKGLLTRRAIFEQAVLAAMAPFYNTEIYHKV